MAPSLMHRIIVVALAGLLVLLGVPTPSPATLNKCAAAKQLCVAKHAAALLTCHGKNTKPPGLDPAKLAKCVQKAKNKLDGGADPAKGCFAKLEARFPGTCLTTGDVSDLAGRVDAFVSEAVCALDPATCPAQTCAHLQEMALAETGTHPQDGSYTLYVGGNPTRPWTAYCRSMHTAQPAEYLTVVEANNYSQISNGSALTETRYRRLRIDPGTLVVDLLDAEFATTDLGVLNPPGGRSNVPAGWAQFVSPQNDDGPPARAQIDLTGTAFALAASVLTDAFFCTVTGAGTSVTPSGTELEVAADLTSFTLSAIDPIANSATKVLADCTHLSAPAEDFTSALLPLQYVGP